MGDEMNAIQLLMLTDDLCYFFETITAAVKLYELNIPGGTTVAGNFFDDTIRVCDIVTDDNEFCST